MKKPVVLFMALFIALFLAGCENPGDAIPGLPDEDPPAQQPENPGTDPAPDPATDSGSVFRKVFAGGESSLVLKEDGTLWAFGNNGLGQLGYGPATDKSAPVRIMTDVKGRGHGSGTQPDPENRRNPLGLRI